MINAYDEYDDFISIFTDIYSLDTEDAEISILYVYCAYRFNDMLSEKNVSSYRLNGIIDSLVENYTDLDISLDLQINAVYNYYNKHHNLPTQTDLLDNIEAFLQEYANE